MTDQVTFNEKLNLLWRKLNNVVNAAQASDFRSQIYKFHDNLLIDNILQTSIPKQIVNNNTYESFNYQYVTIDNLIAYCKQQGRPNGFKINLGNFNYGFNNFSHLEFVFMQELKYALQSQSKQTWNATDPSSNLLINENTTNLLRYTIPMLYDDNPTSYTYRYKLFYSKDGPNDDPTTNNFINYEDISINSDPDYWIIDNQSGFIQFYGGQLAPSGNDVTLTNFCLRSDWSNNIGTKSPPFFCYIRYVGPTGINLSGDTIINGSSNSNTPFEILFNGNYTTQNNIYLNNSNTYLGYLDNSYAVMNNSQLTTLLSNTSSVANFDFYFRFKPWYCVYFDGGYTFSTSDNINVDGFSFNYGNISSSVINQLNLLNTNKLTLKWKIPPRKIINWNYSNSPYNINIVPKYNDLIIQYRYFAFYHDDELGWNNLISISNFPNTISSTIYPNYVGLSDENIEFNLIIEREFTYDYYTQTISFETIESSNIVINNNDDNKFKIICNPGTKLQSSSQYQFRLFLSNNSNVSTAEFPKFTSDLYEIINPNYAYLYFPNSRDQYYETAVERAFDAILETDSETFWTVDNVNAWKFNNNTIAISNTSINDIKTYINNTKINEHGLAYSEIDFDGWDLRINETIYSITSISTGEIYMQLETDISLLSEDISNSEGNPISILFLRRNKQVFKRTGTCVIKIEGTSSDLKFATHDVDPNIPVALPLDPTWQNDPYIDFSYVIGPSYEEAYFDGNIRTYTDISIIYTISAEWSEDLGIPLSGFTILPYTYNNISVMNSLRTQMVGMSNFSPTTSVPRYLYDVIDNSKHNTLTIFYYYPRCTVKQFDGIPFSIYGQQFSGRLYQSGGWYGIIDVPFKDVPYIQPNTSLNGLFSNNYNIASSSYDWCRYLDTRNVETFRGCFRKAHNFNTKINMWVVKGKNYPVLFDRYVYMFSNINSGFFESYYGSFNNSYSSGVANYLSLNFNNNINSLLEFMMRQRNMNCRFNKLEVKHIGLQVQYLFNTCNSFNNGYPSNFKDYQFWALRPWSVEGAGLSRINLDNWDFRQCWLLDGIKFANPYFLLDLDLKYITSRWAVNNSNYLPGYGTINRSYDIDQPFERDEWTRSSLSETIIYVYYVFFYQLQITGERIFTFNQEVNNVYYNPNYRLVNSLGESSVDTSYAISALHNYYYSVNNWNYKFCREWYTTHYNDPVRQFILQLPDTINGYQRTGPYWKDSSGLEHQILWPIGQEWDLAESDARYDSVGDVFATIESVTGLSRSDIFGTNNSNINNAWKYFWPKEGWPGSQTQSQAASSATSNLVETENLVNGQRLPSDYNNLSATTGWSYEYRRQNIYPWTYFVYAGGTFPDPTLTQYYVNGSYNNNPDLAFLVDNSNDLTPTNTFD